MDYITYIRNKVGHDEIFLNFSGAWIQNRRGVLLEKRKDFNCWGLVGGALELGETFQDAVIREVHEETGLNCSVGDLVGLYSGYRIEYPNGDKAQLVSAFFHVFVDPRHDPIPSQEAFEVRYFDPDTLPPIGLCQHRDVIRDALASKVLVPSNLPKLPISYNLKI